MNDCKLAKTESSAYALRLLLQKVKFGLILDKTSYPTCGDPLCYASAHLGLRDKITKWNTDWTDVKLAILYLKEGESIDFPDIPHRKIGNLRSALAQGISHIHIITRRLPKCGVRVIRIGEYYGDKREWLKKFPLLDSSKQE